MPAGDHLRPTKTVQLAADVGHSVASSSVKYIDRFVRLFASRLSAEPDHNIYSGTALVCFDAPTSNHLFALPQALPLLELIRRLHLNGTNQGW